MIVDSTDATNSDNDDILKDMYKVQEEELTELPDENIEKFPQENEQYFRRKKYVRKDKYLLRNLVNMGLQLPTLESAFQS
mmetsp:Transcript_32398/g.48846  ORF Transcript_32398/g.48846 Transcript_32398/m.48846 type:complete len:80 (-) Transcript_32398:75-314(-)